MDEENKLRFAFQCITGDNDGVQVNFTVSDGATWNEVVNRFADFMSAVYGYRIAELDELR